MVDYIYSLVQIIHNVKIYINDTLINQYGYGNSVVSPPLSHMYVGAYGDSNPLNPTSGRYFDGKIHSFFIGDDRFAMEEATGNEIFNQDSTVKATINTSSSTAHYLITKCISYLMLIILITCGHYHK